MQAVLVAMAIMVSLLISGVLGKLRKVSLGTRFFAHGAVREESGTETTGCMPGGACLSACRLRILLSYS